MGVAAVVYGLGVPCLKQYSIMQSLHVSLSLSLSLYFSFSLSFSLLSYSRDFLFSRTHIPSLSLTMPHIEIGDS